MGAPTDENARSRFTRPSTPTLVVLVLLLLQGAFLAWLADDLWFVWGDDYDFLLMRGTVPGVDRSWLEPHDDHWMTSVIAIYRSIFSVVGIRSYLPYAMVPIVFHLLLALVMYVVVRRLGGGAWVAAAGAGFVAFLGAGGQAVLWTTAMGLTGSALLAYVAIYAGLSGGFAPGRTLRVWAPLVLGLTFSGTGRGRRRLRHGVRLVPARLARRGTGAVAPDGSVPRVVRRLRARGGQGAARGPVALPPGTDVRVDRSDLSDG